MNPSDIGGLLSTYAGLVPGVAVAFIASLALGRRVGRHLGVPSIVGFALVIGAGIALAATVTPSRDALVLGIRGSGTCDLGRIGLPSRGELRSPDSEALLNILLFVPLGAAIGLCPPSRRKLAVLAMAGSMPFAIEAAQLLATRLGRECQSADVVDNLVGLTLAITAATLVRWIGTAVAQRGRGGAGPTGSLARSDPDPSA